MARPEGYYSNRTPEWRKYEDTIAGRPKENLPPFERTSITLPEGTLERAKKVGINVSGICSMAILKACNLLEGK